MKLLKFMMVAMIGLLAIPSTAQSDNPLDLDSEIAVSLETTHNLSPRADFFIGKTLYNEGLPAAQFGIILTARNSPVLRVMDRFQGYFNGKNEHLRYVLQAEGLFSAPLGGYPAFNIGIGPEYTFQINNTQIRGFAIGGLFVPGRNATSRSYFRLGARMKLF